MKPTDVSTFDKLRYHLDLFLSRGAWARFVLLFALSFGAVTVTGVFAMLASPDDAPLKGSLLESMWWAMMHVVDSGAMGGDQGTLVRMVAVSATLCGIFVVALLIGLVSSTVGDKIEDLQKGKSPVIDQDHTLILGFGEKVFPILRELKVANESRGKASVVILSEHDKTEVEEMIRERLPDMGGTRVVVRQGSFFSPSDLAKVGAGRARSIVVPAADETDGDADAAKHSDMAVIKTLLALRRVPGALTKNHAVVEIVDAGKKPVIERLGRGGVEVVAMRDVLARLMVQTARQTGLASVYSDILSYDGSELYFKNFPELAGKAFGSVQTILHDAVVVGLRSVGSGGTAKILLNPPADHRIGGEDEILVLAEDDDTFSVQPNAPRAVVVPEVPRAGQTKRSPERLLICGFRSDLSQLVAEFDNYASPGSVVQIMAGERAAQLEAATAAERKNLKVELVPGDATDPMALQRACQAHFDAVLIVADDTGTAQESDARTVITLLLLRDLVKDRPAAKQPRLISEILDPRTKDLVSGDASTDFVVSTEITSMLLAQVSERRELNAVFSDLFDPEGNEVYLKGVEAYAVPGAGTSWLAVQEVAKRRGEIAIGAYRPGTHPVMNPKQGLTMTFAPGDKIVVLAEDDREGAALQRAA